MTDNTPNRDDAQPVEQPVDETARPPVLPTLLELDQVVAAISTLLPDFDIDRIISVTLTPNDAAIRWLPAGAPDPTGDVRVDTVPVLNRESLAALNGRPAQ